MSWIRVCDVADIVPNTGVCARVEGRQVAVFRVADAVYAIDNIDPFTQAGVLSRGLVGTKGDVLKVASPLLKQQFDLTTGACLDDDSVRIDVWPARMTDGAVEVEFAV